MHFKPRFGVFKYLFSLTVISALLFGVLKPFFVKKIGGGTTGRSIPYRTYTWQTLKLFACSLALTHKNLQQANTRFDFLTFIHLLTLLRININMSLACSVGLIPIDHNLEFKVMYNEITQRRIYIICRDVKKYNNYQTAIE